MELFRGYKKNSTFASEIIHGIYAYEVYSANIQKNNSNLCTCNSNV